MSRAVARLHTTAKAATAGVATALVTTVLLAAPAFADNPIGDQEGEQREPAQSTLTTLLLYVVLPLSVALVVAAVVWLPGAVRANRYRPSAGWTAPPVWFAGPPEPVAAVQSAEVGDVVRGGASGSW